MDSCLTQVKELSEERHVLRKQETLLERVAVQRAAGRGTQENSSAMWLAVSSVMVMGTVSGLSLANHYDSGSFLVVRVLLSQDGCQ